MTASLCLTTCPDRATATLIADRVVGERLAACVNIVPGMTAVYRWEGALQHDDELLLLFKTGSDRIDALRERVLALHPYDVPAFVVLDIGAGSAAYLDWIATETRA